MSAVLNAPASTQRHATNRFAEPKSQERSRVTLLVVDDQAVVSWGFRYLLGQVPWVARCLQAKDLAEAEQLARRFGPTVALIDLDLGAESGLETCAAVRESSSHTQILLMSTAPSVPDRVLRDSGASGFVSKSWPIDDIISVIRVVGLGLTFRGPAEAPRTEGVLSEREHDVLARIATGATNREIAAALLLSPHTVKQHASAAFRKLNARNRTDAVQRARRLGLVL
jgi:DNA-binding NarL/FixJ family response regulator